MPWAKGLIVSAIGFGAMGRGQSYGPGDGTVLATVKFWRPVDPPELTLRPEIRHVDALSVLWLEAYLPLAAVLEFMFDKAFHRGGDADQRPDGPKDIMLAPTVRSPTSL